MMNVEAQTEKNIQLVMKLSHLTYSISIFSAPGVIYILVEMIWRVKDTAERARELKIAGWKMIIKE